MFSSKAQLKQRTPVDGTNREEYLSLLVDEYLNSTSFGAKSQVLANLANFAYDPVNYRFIRDVGVLDIFLFVLKNETNIELLRFACAGICNLCLDPVNADYILTHAGLKPIIDLLKCSCSDIVADSISTLLYFNNYQTNPEIANEDVKQIMQHYRNGEDKRLVNLSNIFLQDVFGMM